jgi:four helix bundle protein
MKENNIIQIKSFNFALKAIELYKDLIYNQKEYVLSKQLLRSSTSIGANIEEAIGGISRRDFRAKLSIAYKESRETIYWLKLLFKSKFISKNTFDALSSECHEIIKILASILLTLERK